MNGEGIFARRERLESEIREAKKDLIREKRAERDLRKLQSGGRVTPFLRREADKSQAIAAAVNLATASNPLALGQAVIQYQSAINESKRDPLKTENKPKPERPQETGGGTATIPPHPWQILLRVTILESGGQLVEFKVESNSKLYSGLGSWSNIEITDIGTWKEASLGYVILFGVVDGGICTEASIQIQETLSDRIDVVDGSQNSFAVQLGYIYQEGGSLLVRQNAFHNFTIVDSCSGGSTFIYPIPT